MADAARPRCGKVNVLINNTGIDGPGSVTEVDEDFWDTIMDANLKSMTLPPSKHAIPRMIEGGGSMHR
jgi:NAD(P)-dependent dehydrogenase (short-subunit alcohol dehydrogenase family)